MKKIYKNIAIISLLFTVLFSCETDYQTFDTSKSYVYFNDTLVKFGFGLSPLSLQEDTIKVPVKTMGVSKNIDREFQIELVSKSDVTIEDKHFRKIKLTQKFEADSINSYVEIPVLRKDMDDNTEYELRIRLVDNNTFGVANKDYSEARIIFHNTVNDPMWKKKYGGGYLWPYEMGDAFNKIVYLKFIELFREIETKAPQSYNDIITKCGIDCLNDYPFDYNYTLKKYIYIPLYEYFNSHPELGIDWIPNPNE